LIKTSGVKPKVDTSYEKQGLEERKTDIGKFERPEDVSPWVAGKIKGKLTPICISIIILLLALAAGMYFYLAIPIYYSLIPVALAVATATVWIVKLVAYKRVKKPKQKKA
jgi:Flp pilus assembly protein TadB